MSSKQKPKPAQRWITKSDLVKAVAYYKPYFGITDWSDDVAVVNDMGQLATVNYIPANEFFVLKFNSKRYGPESPNTYVRGWWNEFCRLICHELTHVRLGPAIGAYDNRLRNYISEAELKQFHEDVYYLEDAAVNGLGTMIWRLAPRLRDDG